MDPRRYPLHAIRYVVEELAGGEDGDVAELAEGEQMVIAADDVIGPAVLPRFRERREGRSCRLAQATAVVTSRWVMPRRAQ